MNKELFQKLKKYEKILTYSTQGYLAPLTRGEKEELFDIHDTLFTIPCKRNYSCSKCVLTATKKIAKEYFNSQNYKMSKIHELRQLENKDK